MAGADSSHWPNATQQVFQPKGKSFPPPQFFFFQAGSGVNYFFSPSVDDFFVFSPHKRLQKIKKKWTGKAAGYHFFHKNNSFIFLSLRVEWMGNGALGGANKSVASFSSCAEQSIDIPNSPNRLFTLAWLSVTCWSIFLCRCRCSRRSVSSCCVKFFVLLSFLLTKTIYRWAP